MGPADGAGVERSIDSGGEASSKPAFPFPP
jgi:hypothetical protein